MAELHHSEAEADEASKRRGVCLAFKRVFEDNPDGRIVLDVLERAFARRIIAPATIGGPKDRQVVDGFAQALETYRLAGRFEVMDFINTQLNLAINGGRDDSSSQG